MTPRPGQDDEERRREAERLRDLAARTDDPVERDRRLDSAAELDRVSLTGDGSQRERA